MLNYDSHCFNVELATIVGLREAIVLQHIWYWVHHNSVNEEMYKDGNIWTFTSRKKMNETFPYLSEKMIRGATERLEADGYIKIGEYNKKSYNKTIWYTLTEKGYNLYGTTLKEVTAPFDKRANGFDKRANQEDIEKDIESNGKEMSKEKPLDSNEQKSGSKQATLPLDDKNSTNCVGTNPPPSSARPLPFSSEEFLHWWNILLKQKKWKGKTENAMKLSIEKLEKLNEAQAILMIKDTIENGWQGFFPERYMKIQVAPKAPQPKPKPIWEQYGVSEEEYNKNKKN